MEFKTISLTIRLPADLAQKVRSAAKADQRTVNSWVNAQLVKILEKKTGRL